MRVSVDADVCAGHGDCVTICPAVFALTDGGYAEAIDTEVPARYAELTEKAVRECPEHAITVD